ncbi:50S ribosomal protein L1, apicoplast [Plasmodium gonderi]|uniref:50S ribosomal protein L1, apicoplast n=1 Tax=Plasmodium gonderi TaxID=77519 RepID=A0A1Y1JQT8_PLAGO|nr:50S ribosomal protein L1, apicoplast [Plasmodium gonderi]GAW82833.1 50S ribosomal protein L1, apicoplast [Plasmodium gonderi]
MTKKYGYKVLVEFVFLYILASISIIECYLRSRINNKEIISSNHFNSIFRKVGDKRKCIPWLRRSSVTWSLVSLGASSRPQLPQLPQLPKLPQLPHQPLSQIPSSQSAFPEEAPRSGSTPQNEVTEHVKLKKKDKKILKKYKDFLDILPKRDTEYGINDAIEKIKTLAIHKFVESIDIYLSFNQKKSKMTKNDNIKTFITFPHNLKKKREKKVYVVTNKDLQKRATDSGADVVGEDDLINKIKEKEIRLKKKNNNFLLCTNDVIHKMTRIGKEVGSKGLMPNEKSGTLVSEFLLEKHVKLFKFGNSYIFKLNKLNTLNLNVGDVNMSNDEIRENICYLFDHLDNLEFFHFNSKNLKSIFLSSTMGFPFKIKKNFL